MGTSTSSATRDTPTCTRAAALGGIQPNPLPFATDDTLPLEAIECAIKPDDPHFAITRLLCLENTQAGKVLPLDYLADWSAPALRRGLKRHLDGARMFNATVALGVPVADICAHFDTVSLCLYKGLGSPVGPVLVGDTQSIGVALSVSPGRVRSRCRPAAGRLPHLYTSRSRAPLTATRPPHKRPADCLLPQRARSPVRTRSGP